MVLRRNASFNKQIKDVLKEYILLGSIYTKEDINKILTTVVTRLNLKRVIKISDYYIVESIVLREGGKLKRVNKIIGYL